MILVGQGTPRDADDFFASRWNEARVVSDENRDLYGAFDLARATVTQLFAPGVFGAFWKNRRHGVGLPVGDALLLAGAFVVDGGRVFAEHRSANPADHPDWRELLELVRARRAAAPPA